MSRIAGVDFGLKRIGLALSDPGQTLASPLPTVHSLEEALGALKGQEVVRLVVGMPHHLHGGRGTLADQVEAFGQKLGAELGVPVLFWDERLTSLQAERSLKEQGLNRRKRAKVVDQLAAVLILQSYLDSLAAMG